MRGLILGLLPLAACLDDRGDDTTPPPPPPDAGTPDAGFPALLFYRDVKPILDGRCVGCHHPGGVGPLDLTNPELVQIAAASIRVQVESRTMPPWHAGKDCKTFKNDRSLSDGEIQTIVDWVALGAPLGPPELEGPPIPPIDFGVDRIDLRVMTEELYTPARQDDYRCFVIRWPEATTKYISGFNLEPSNPAIVHHANLYIGGPGQTAQGFITQDTQAAGPGYPCFGGAFEPGVALLGSWAPGSTGIAYPEGTGIQIDPGSVIVAEMHFNIGADRDGPDQSTLALKLEDAVAKPALIAPFWNFQTWGNGGMPIPMGEADVMHTFQLNPDGLIQFLAPWFTARRMLFHGAGLHMHFLGTRGTIKVIRPQNVEECVLDIPRWDFNWQYGYLHDEPIPFELGLDQIYLECHWDNTMENQPLIDGVRRPAVDVNWGSGSGDEMCIGYLYVTAGD
jgi:hypothetical protein